MTQSSRPQAGNCTVNPAYVDAGPWSRDEWAEKVKAENTGDSNTANQRTRLRGVMPTNDNLLIVTNPAGVSIVVGTGVGITTGSLFFNTAAVTFAPNTPGIASRTDKVVMVENNTNVAYTGAVSAVILDFPADLTDYSGAASVPPYSCRLAILRGDAATGNATALVQTADYWMIELARFNITNVPAVNTLTDNREFANIEKVVGVVAADNATIEDALILGTEVNNGAGAAGLGTAIRAKLENASGELYDAGQLAFRWTDATDGGEESRIELRLVSTSAYNLSAVINAPTTGSVDGNARGAGAIDLQQARSAVTEVANGAASVISGGRFNTASGDDSTVGGGYVNTASGNTATVGGGANNLVSGYASVIAGGGGDDLGMTLGNSIVASDYASIIGGIRNRITNSSDYTTICGGRDNTINDSAPYSVIGGGWDNIAGGGGIVCGGVLNRALHTLATVGGGQENVAEGNYSMIPGGLQNTADGDYSLAAGNQADTNSFDGVFIWADSENAAFTADRANQFKVRASGGAHFVQNTAAAALPVVTYEQQDVDEPFHKFIGDAAAATLTRDLVAEADVTTATRVGFYKIEILDDGNQITDGDYFVPFYSLA